MFFIYIFIVFITFVFFSIVFSMLILNLFFGIPQTIKLKKQGFLLKTASIKPYLVTFFLWSIITFVVILCLSVVLNKEYFSFVICGIIMAILFSFRSLSKDNFQNNMADLLSIQALYINPEFIDLVNNGINNVLLKKANEIAQSRGFNTWDELESAFLHQNNITFEKNIDFEYKLNFIANYQGFRDFNELYINCINKSQNIQKNNTTVSNFETNEPSENSSTLSDEYDEDLEDIYSNGEE